MNKKLIVAIVALVAVVGILLGVWYATRPAPEDGLKSITITVVHGDESTRDFNLKTDAEYLGPVLLDEKIVEGEMGDYGLYIHSADGEEAVWETDNAYWSIYEGDVPAVAGADAIVLTDGGVYKLVYTRG